MGLALASGKETSFLRGMREKFSGSVSNDYLFPELTSNGYFPLPQLLKGHYYFFLIFTMVKTPTVTPRNKTYKNV